MHLKINLKFYLSSDIRNCINNIDYSFPPYLLDPFNSLYAERLLFNLSDHFLAYQSKRMNNIWNVDHQGNFLDIPGISMMKYKHMITGVSGNTGESLIIPSLIHATGNCHLKYCRITSGKKCPDFRIELSNSLITLWGINTCIHNKKLPFDVPLEVKSHFKSDNDYPVTALKQLLSYWTIMLEANMDEYVGMGIIARVNLEPNNFSIRYFLFLPNDRRHKKYINWICQSNNTENEKVSFIQKKVTELFL